MSLYIDTMKFINSIQIITDLHGKTSDDNPFYSNYMSIFSFILANNGFIERWLEIPSELLNDCKILCRETGIKEASLFEIRSTNYDDDLVA